MIDIIPSKIKKEYEIIKTNQYQVYNFLNTYPSSIEGLKSWGVSIFSLISADIDYNSYFFDYLNSKDQAVQLSSETLVSIVNNSFMENGISATMEIGADVNKGGLLLTTFFVKEEKNKEIKFKAATDV